MFRRLIVTGLLLSCIAPMALAETVDDVVAKYIQARGGMEKIKSVSSMKATGKMVMGGGAMEAPFVRVSRRPSDIRMEFTIQGLTGVQAFDGKAGVAWMIMPFMGKKDPEIQPAEETKLMAEEADFDGPLVNWKDKGHKVELMGTEQVEGADAYKLKLTRKSGNVDYVYVDAETGLEVKSESKRMIRGAELEMQSLMGDYKDVDGVLLPFTISAGAKDAPAEQMRKIVIEKYEFNTPAADSLFAVPANAVKAEAKAAASDTSKDAKADEKAATDDKKK
jgi:hypothetical protein